MMMSDNDDENNDNIIIIIDQELRTKILDKFQQRVREMIKQTMEGVPPKLTLTYKQASRILLKDKGRVAKEIDDEILNDLLDDLRRGGYILHMWMLLEIARMIQREKNIFGALCYRQFRQNYTSQNMEYLIE